MFPFNSLQLVANSCSADYTCPETTLVIEFLLYHNGSRILLGYEWSKYFFDINTQCMWNSLTGYVIRTTYHNLSDKYMQKF